jgi:hypothetical protein
MNDLELVDLMFGSSNLISNWLSRVDQLRRADAGDFARSNATATLNACW